MFSQAYLPVGQSQTVDAQARHLLEQEARALLTRLDRIKPFALQETLVAAAAPSLAAQVAIERYLASGRKILHGMVTNYRQWLYTPEAQRASPEEAQRLFTFLRLRFNSILSQFDIFADVMTQRSEYETGVWLAGLDLVAADALTLPGGYFEPPPVVCYLDRGYGAAIRRARTRLPGGGENPAAVIRVPRERMVGSGIASSLVHEVGHQGAALLDLINSLRPVLRRLQGNTRSQPNVWQLWERWISEILADFWSVARVGVTSTVGLMGVVSLPRAFVFRVALDDPHPIPWVRVKLSCALGQALYPDPQWGRLDAIWEAYYPLADLDDRKQQLLRSLEEGMANFISLLLNHRPKSLGGTTLGEAMTAKNRQPNRLRAIYRTWRGNVEKMRRAPPTLVFAVIGQARADGKLSPEAESRLLAELLTYWAVRSTLDSSAICARQRKDSAVALAT